MWEERKKRANKESWERNTCCMQDWFYFTLLLKFLSLFIISWYVLIGLPVKFPYYYLYCVPQFVIHGVTVIIMNSDHDIYMSNKSVSEMPVRKEELLKRIAYSDLFIWVRFFCCGNFGSLIRISVTFYKQRSKGSQRRRFLRIRRWRQKERGKVGRSEYIYYQPITMNNNHRISLANSNKAMFIMDGMSTLFISAWLVHTYVNGAGKSFALGW